ncbi:hypothetical protein B0H16DRAFT_1461482 [Mycena metata]|uniref:Uncharacterized protein n=1 Tax=Mycena metata TaxID=1033252 RepID=A0AAD7IRH1_9AGAR|nr:hypothetical protein B0H16DRAFT_1461482 [Mycena metata]
MALLEVFWSNSASRMEDRQSGFGTLRLIKKRVRNHRKTVWFSARNDHCGSRARGPVYVFPFEVSDLEKVEVAIESMLVQTKKLFRFGVSMHRSIEKDWKKVCLEVGLAETNISVFGEDWRIFAEAYITLDYLLIRSGKAPQLLAAEPFPEALQDWSQQLDVDGNLPIGNETDWETEMDTISGMITTSITSAQEAQVLDRVLEETWSRRGKGGLFVWS